MKIISVCLLVWLACCIRSVAEVPHDIHQSMTRIEWNANTGKLVVLVNCFVDDFQLAVMKHHGKPIRPDDDSLMHYCLQYLNTAISISIDEKKLLLQDPIDANISELSIHFMFEINSAKPPKKIDIYNNLINNIYSDQLNMVQVAINSKEQMLEFDAVRKSQQFLLKK